MTRQIEKMLSEICAEAGWAYVAMADGWVLSADGCLVYGYHFGLNGASADRLCDDKAATYGVLSAAGVPAVAHEYLSRESCRVTELLSRLDEGPLVLKPNNGTGGRGVTKVSTADELRQGLTALCRDLDSLAVSPFEDIVTEYRAIVLAGRVALLYAKRRTAESGWKFNLGQGATAELIARDEGLTELALSAMAALGLVFASVDIVRLTDGRLKVLEVNSGVMMERFACQSADNYERAKAIYRAALLLARRKL